MHAILATLFVLASIPRSIAQTSMGLKSDKTFEDIVERLVALVDPPPADNEAKVDGREETAADQSDENGAVPSSTIGFDQKKR